MAIVKIKVRRLTNYIGAEVSGLDLSKGLNFLVRGHRKFVEVRKSVQDRFNVLLQRRMVGTSWAVANNYFKVASGRIVTQWPDGALTYGVCTKLFRRMTWTSGRFSERPAPALTATASRRHGGEAIAADATAPSKQ